MLKMYTLGNWTAYHRWALLRAGVVGAILLISVVLVPRIGIGNRSAVYLFAAYLALVAALIFLKWPALGLLIVIPASFYIPFGLSVGSGNSLGASFVLVAFLSALWLADMVVRHKSVEIVNARPLLVLAAFALVAILAFGVGQLPWLPLARQAPISAQLAGLAIYLISALCCALAAHQVRQLRWLEAITRTFLIFGAIVIAGRLIPAISTQAWLLTGAVGSLFWTWLVALAASQAIFNQRLKLFWRLALAGLAAATLVVAWSQFRSWASGWAPAFVTLMAILWLRSWRWGLVMTLVGIGVVLLLDPGLPSRLLAVDEYSISTRWVAWQIVLQMVQVNPILGLGPANYYHYAPLFSILGWHVQFNSHSQYVDLIAQTGVLGLLSFLWFGAEMLKLGWRLRTEAPAGFGRAYAYGALAGLAGTAVAGGLGDWIVPFVYNISFSGLHASLMAWLFLGGLVALEQMGQAEPAGRD